VGGYSGVGLVQLFISIASVGQACAQNEQPIQFFASTRAAIGRTWWSTNSAYAMTPVGQDSMQAPQVTQRSAVTTGLSHKVRLIPRTVFPCSSRTASTGQMRPQAAQSMQTAGLMVCSSPRVPVMAATGHILTQAVQPVHNAVMVWLKQSPPLVLEQSIRSIPSL